MPSATAGTQPLTLRPFLALSALLATTQVHGQQNINVTAANSVTNQIYSVTFAPPGGSTTVLNTDAKSLFSLQSLVFVPDNNPGTSTPTFSFDLLAADNQKGKILRYTGDFSSINGNPIVTTGQVISQAIAYPTGLSVDAGGNLFVVDDSPGHSPLPQVWVLTANQSGGFNPAVLIDSTSFGKLEATLESLIVGPALGTSANSGDLLVVTSNPTTVLRYAGSGGNGPTGPTTPTTLIPQCPATPICIPAGTVPGGIAVWPEDNSLLISTQTGSILRYSFSGSTPTQLPDFFDGLPTILFKIKTGYQGGLARAFVVQSAPGNHGSVIELGPTAPDGQIQLLATVTTGVAAPEGIAVTNAVQAPASNCQQNSPAGGCDLLGGTGPTVLKHIVNGNLTGDVVEDICVVQTDPRPVSGAGVCGDATLSVNQVCPGFDNTGKSLVIPGYLCGQSGSTGKGFALVRTLSYPGQYNGKNVQSIANVDTILPPNTGSDPVCGPPSLNSGLGIPIDTLVWAPLNGEGNLVEGSNMVDITSGCGSSHGTTTHMSLWAIGLALDTTASEFQGGSGIPLANFALTKYGNLTTTVDNLTASKNIAGPVSLELTNPNPPPNGCIDASLQLFNQGISQPGMRTALFQDAADLLTNAAVANTGKNAALNTTCDSIVTNNLSSFTESPNANPPVWNPSGQVRSRLANLYYTINTLILGNPTSGAWPPPVSISVSPQSAASGKSATLSWAIGTGASSCTLSSNDPNFTQTNPTASGSVTVSPPKHVVATYTYTLNCTVPPGTMIPPPDQISVSAYLSIT